MLHKRIVVLLAVMMCGALCAAPALAFGANDASTLTATSLTASDETEADEETDEADSISGSFMITMGSKSNKAITVLKKKATVGSADESDTDQHLYLHSEGADTVSIQSVGTGAFLRSTGSKVKCESYVEGDESFLWTIKQKSKGYVLTNVSTNKNLTFNGVKIVGGNAATVWNLKSVAIVPNGNYVLVNSAKSMVLSVKGSDFDAGARMIMAKNTGYLNEVFSFKRLNDEEYLVKSALSNRAVGVETSRELSAVQQGTPKAIGRQMWKITMNKAGGLLFTNSASGYVMSAEGNGGNRKYVDAETNGNLKTQAWSVESSDLKYNKAVERAAQIIENRKSKTAYYVTVDKTSHWLTVFKGDQGQWVPLRAWIVSIGTSGWPTPTGNFTIGWKGKSFGEDHGYSVYWYTNYAVINGYDYHFHSIKYYPYTMKVMDGRLGRNISGGCVRMAYDNAKWLHDTVKRNSAVKIYS